MKSSLKIFSSKNFESLSSAVFNSNRIQFLVAVFLVILILMPTSFVSANECVQCPSASTNEFVCGVDDDGIFRKFGSECLLRFENCDKKTSELKFLSFHEECEKFFRKIKNAFIFV